MESSKQVPDWTGQTVAVLAGGTSLTQTSLEIVRQRGWKTIAINTTYKKAMWSDVLLGADADWWRHYYARQLEKFEGPKFHCQRFCNIEDVEYYAARPVANASNSAVHATHFAQDAKASRVVLVGIDLKITKLTHHHGDHPRPLRNPTASDFRMALASWRKCAPGMKKTMEVVNANPNSALDVFPRVSLEVIL